MKEIMKSISAVLKTFECLYNTFYVHRTKVLTLMSFMKNKDWYNGKITEKIDCLQSILFIIRK